MAAERDAQTDIKAHVQDYSSFIAMLKWGTIICAIVAMLVIFIIA